MRRVTVLERFNARALRAGAAPVRAGPDHRSTCRSSHWRRCSRGARRAPRRASTAWRWSSRSSRSGARRSARAASCASPRLAARRSWRSRGAARTARRERARLRVVRAAGPEGQSGDVRVARRGRAPGASRTSRRRRARWSREPPGRRVTVVTHRRRGRSPPRCASCVACRRARGVDAAASTRTRPRKHGLEIGAGRRAAGPSAARRRPLLRARRRRHDPAPRCATTRAPASRCSRSTTARSASSRPSSPTTSDATSRAPSPATSRSSSCRRSRRGGPEGELDGDQRHLRPPQGRPARRRPRVCARGRGDRPRALRRPRRRHPQGSTGYNLANGGPVMAWGVEGYVVSFIAPHSLTARALVVAPEDELTINNAPARSRSRSTSTAARPRAAAGERLRIEFARRSRRARPAPGRVVLPPPAREVRPPGVVTSVSEASAPRN